MIVKVSDPIRYSSESYETGGHPCSFNFRFNQACAMTVRSSNVFFFLFSIFWQGFYASTSLGLGYITFFF